MTTKLTSEEKSRRFSQRFEDIKNDFFCKARAKHRDFFSYDKAAYISARDKIIITCPIHGDFFQTPDSHLKHGCEKCGRAVQNNKKRFDNNIFISKSKLVHGNRYDYSKVEYKNARSKITIICPEHGEWSIVPDAHLRGNGCNLCGNKSIGNKLRQSLSDFIKRAEKIHGEKYDYSLVEYVNAQTAVLIICREHGVFDKRPDCHVNRDKSGCPRCSDRWKSESDWLTMMGVPNDHKHRQVTLKLYDGSSIRVDGKIGNTVYEFWGTYYHGHPSYFCGEDKTYYNRKFSDLYAATKNKISRIEKSGYTLVQRWEHDWAPQRFRSIE